MANINSDLYTLEVAAAADTSQAPNAHAYGGAIFIKECKAATVSASTNNDDLINLCFLPAGARVIPGLSFVQLSGDPGTALTIDIGTAADPDGFADGMALSSGGSVFFSNTGVALQATTPARLTARTLVYATVASTDTLSGNRTLTFWIAYTLGGDGANRPVPQWSAGPGLPLKLKMTDDFEIANLALSLIGGKPLTALNNDTAQGTACTRWFDTARDECLRSHPWNFARKRALLTWLSLSGTAVMNSGGLIKITRTAHGLTTGDQVMIEEIAGVTAANGAWPITRVNDNEFTLDGSAFAGTYTTGTGRYLAQPEFGWAYRHTLPADCLRVMRINGADGQENDSEPFEVEAGLLLTDAAAVELRYI
eukprot:gene42678-52146_t